MTDVHVPSADPTSADPTSVTPPAADGAAISSVSITPVVVDTAVVSVAPVPSAVAVGTDTVTLSHTASTEPITELTSEPNSEHTVELPPASTVTAAVSGGSVPTDGTDPVPAVAPTSSRAPGTDRQVGAKAIGPSPAIDAGDVLVSAADLVIGTAWWATGPLRAVGRLGIQAVEAGLAGATARSRRLQLRAQAHRGDARSTLDLFIQAVLRPIIKRVVDAALAELDLTEIVLEHVDLDRVAAALDVDGIVAGVDLDAAVARVDLDAAVGRVDLDAAVSRVDLDAAVRRVDLDQIVSRIDVDGIVAGVDIGAVVSRVDIESIVNRLDLDEIAGRLDIDGIVAKVDLQAIVDRLDIAGVVAKVDPDPVVARVNFDAAMKHIDLIGIAQRVVDGIDLPGIIRESTGSLATEAVAGVRVQGQAADDAVGQLVGRVLRRRALDPPPRHQW